MRISDWSSDVCSSDLKRGPVVPESLRDERGDDEEPAGDDDAVVRGRTGDDRPHARRDTEMFRRRVVQRRVPEQRDGHGPHDHAVRTEGVDAVEALEHMPMDEHDPERGAGLEPPPAPTRKRSEEPPSELQPLMRRTET